MFWTFLFLGNVALLWLWVNYVIKVFRGQCPHCGKQAKPEHATIGNSITRLRSRANTVLLVHNREPDFTIKSHVQVKNHPVGHIPVPVLRIAGTGYGLDGGHLLGVWKMEPRILRRENYDAYQEEAIIAITERLPDGRYTVLARMTSRVVAEVKGLIDIPGCEDKKECTFDDATEGIGSSFRSAFYVDYFAANWIDDLFTVKGNVMTADDGNGPIKLIKIE